MGWNSRRIMQRHVYMGPSSNRYEVRTNPDQTEDWEDSSLEDSLLERQQGRKGDNDMRQNLHAGERLKFHLWASVER